MKKLLGISIVIMSLAVIRVNALEYYFYKTAGANGTYSYTLCEGNDNNCHNYTTTQLESAGAIITESTIKYGPGGTVYKIKNSNSSSSSSQTNNSGTVSSSTNQTNNSGTISSSTNQTNNGNSTSYYFYKSPGANGTNNFTLCDGSDANCKDYTKEQLDSMGAGITDESINFGPGGNVYYFKSSLKYLEPGATSPSGGTTGGNTTTGNNTTTNVEKKPVTDTCTRLKEPLKFIGHLVTIFKIIIPIILIAFGMMDFFRAVTAGKDDEIKKSVKTFALRVVAGVVIFFLPTLVSFIFSMIDSWAEFEGDFNACQKCVFRVSKCE